MRVGNLLIIGVACAALAACQPPHPRDPFRTVTSLTCPQAQGALTRTAAAADGRSCDYAGPDGAQVTLQIVALANGDVDGALAPLETRLRSEVPAATAGADGADGRGRVDIDLPGLHIHASGGDDGDGQVKIGRAVAIQGGGAPGVSVDARQNGAEVNIDEGRGGVRRDFVLASDAPGPNGWRVAGIIARGPTTGPIVVASLLGKADDHGPLDRDMRALVTRNVGRSW